MTTSTSHRHIKKRLIKTVGAHTPCSCGYMQGGELYFYIKDYQGNVRVVLNQANQPVEINSYYPYGGLMAATTTEGTLPHKIQLSLHSHESNAKGELASYILAYGYDLV